MVRMAPDRPCSDDEGGNGAGQSNGVSVPVTLISTPNTILHIKEGDGATMADKRLGYQKIVGEDDDLTSLSWLLKPTIFESWPNEIKTPVAGAQQSPTSDFVDDTASEPSDSTCSSVNSSSSPLPAITHAIVTGKNKHPHHIPYDPLVHVTSKPPYSFSCLIFMSIEDSPAKALPVKDIYAWILDHFPYYKNAPTGWKNSVRHNLSLNKCFRKVEKAPNLGKGSLWMVDPTFRPNLVQAMKKAPYHPYSNQERPPASARTQHIQHKSVMTDQEFLSSRTGNKSPPHASAPNGRLSDPELYPFLSRHLEASGAENSGAETEEESLDDVDAAAAMLALKHGPNVRISIRQRDEYQRQLSANKMNSGRPKRKSKDESGNGSASVLITSCPSEDHTYSVEPIHLAADVKSEPCSPDEAFQEGSDSNSSWAVRLKMEPEDDIEEQRKIAEGADALLNLAGITTSHMNHHREKSESDSRTSYVPNKSFRLNEEPNEPFRPRLLRKSPMKRETDESELGKKYWKPGIVSRNSSNNTIINSPSSSSSTPVTTMSANRMRRKPILTLRNSSKIKR